MNHLGMTDNVNQGCGDVRVPEVLGKVTNWLNRAGDNYLDNTVRRVDLGTDMLYLLLATYVTVFLAEMIGDKSFYTISSLVSRFRSAYVLGGISIAFAFKMLVAIMVGKAIGEIPSALVASVSAATFLWTAGVIWFKKPAGRKQEIKQPQSWARETAFPFAAIFLTEWGDVGQIAAATFVARYNAPFIIWVGATAALITKGLLAISIGVALQSLVPQRAVRLGAFSMCILMGILAVLRIH